MLITVTRLDSTDNGIFGHLTVDVSDFNCVTLERHDIAIPKGLYPIELYDSPHNGLVPLLRNVPGRDMIEIHAGNWEYQSRGCILVGKTRAVIEGKDGISGSRDTTKQLVKLIQAHRGEGLAISIS